MGNDEAQMTNAEGMAKPERLSSFEHSSLFRHSSFVIRISSFSRVKLS